MSLILLSLLNKWIRQRLELNPETIELKPGDWESALYPALSLSE